MSSPLLSSINYWLGSKQEGIFYCLSQNLLELASQAALFLDNCRLSNSICGPQELAEQQATSISRQLYCLHKSSVYRSWLTNRQLLFLDNCRLSNSNCGLELASQATLFLDNSSIYRSWLTNRQLLFLDNCSEIF